MQDMKRKNIKIKAQTIFEEGDTIVIDDMTLIDVLPDDARKELVEVHPKDYELEQAKRTFNYIYGDSLKTMNQITGTLKAHRLDHDSGHLVVEWHGDVDEDWKETNVYFLEAIGFQVQSA